MIPSNDMTRQLTVADPDGAGVQHRGWRHINDPWVGGWDRWALLPHRYARAGRRRSAPHRVADPFERHRRLLPHRDGSLVLDRISELLPHQVEQQKAAWSFAAVGFALMQAAAAYGLSFVFARNGGDYRPLSSSAQQPWWRPWRSTS
jgi:hypothetical protein